MGVTRARWTGLIGALAALAIGGVASAAETPATPEQAQAVAAALAGVDGSPHWMNIDGSVSLALSNSTNKLAFTLGDEFRAIGKIEGPRRARWSMSESLAFTDIPLILHDGKAYLRDSGEPYFDALNTTDAAVARLILEPQSQRLRPTRLDQMSGLVDLGPDVTDGVATRHYRAVLPGEFTKGLIEGLLEVESSISAAEREKTLAAFTFPAGTVDIWTDASGALWRQSMTMTSSVDVKKALGASTGSGSGGFGIDVITATLKTSYHPYAVGTPVTVIRPPAKPATRKIPTQDQFQIDMATYLLERAGSALDTYAIVKGSYRGATTRTLGRLAPGVTFQWSGRTRAARDEVLIRELRPGRYVLSTRTASGYALRLSKSLGTAPRMTCRVGKRRCPGFEEEPVRGTK